MSTQLICVFSKDRKFTSIGVDFVYRSMFTIGVPNLTRVLLKKKKKKKKKTHIYDVIEAGEYMIDSPS